MKTNLLKGLSLMAAVVLLLTVAFAGCKNSDTFALEDFKAGDDYQLKDAPWDITEEKLKADYPLGVKENEALRPEGESSVKNYIAETAVTMDGMEGKPEFRFYDGVLDNVRISFVPQKEDTDVKAWFEKTCKEMEKLYGSDYELIEDSFNGTHFTSYLWENEKHTLEFRYSSAGEVLIGSNTIVKRK